jgi:hypothetical protein
MVIRWRWIGDVRVSGGGGTVEVGLMKVTQNCERFLMMKLNSAFKLHTDL